MFDRYEIGETRTEHVTREIHEHRAPTDESVKILREMETMAWDRCVDRMVAEAGDNRLAITLCERAYDLANQRHKLRAVFTVNGQKWDIPVDLGYPETSAACAAGARVALTDKAIKVLAEAIAVRIVTENIIQFR